MIPSSSPALLRWWIGLELKRLRLEAGKSRTEVLGRLRLSRAQLGHLETGERLPTPPVLEIMLGYYGQQDRLPGFLQLVEAARKGRNWWEKLTEAVPEWFNLYLGLESGAAELCSYGAAAVPGLLQTESYAEVTIRADPDLTDAEVRQRVELRCGRQQILDRDTDPVRLWVVLEESVLHKQRGSKEIMRAQLEHLLQMSQRPRIDVQILRNDAGPHMAEQGGTFTLLKFPAEMGHPGLIYVELLTTGIYVEDPDDIATYRRTWDRLLSQAASLEDSRGILREALEQ